MSTAASTPPVSVLIVQWGETDLTDRALEAVRRSRYDGRVELLVWDNGSPNGPGDVGNASDVVLVRHADNVGFGVANNRLAEQATGDLLLFLNNDTLLTPSALARMVAVLTSDPRIAVVAPQFRGFDGSVLEIGGFVGDSGEAWQLMRGTQPPRALQQRPLHAHYGSAACLLVRRRDFLAVGGFDDLFSPAYYEDTDLCLRLARDGRRVVVEPRAVVYHLEGGTAGTDVLAGGKRHLLRHRSRFTARWWRELERLPPVSRGAVLRQALTGGERPLVLWLLPDFLKHDQSGGHARVRNEIEALVESGTAVAVWSEHLGDSGRYGPLLDELGVFWVGYHEPTRSLLGQRHASFGSTLQELLALEIWDAVVAWSADVAHRFGPTVRAILPKIPFVVDSAVLLYRQCERGLAAGATVGQDLAIEKAWELECYAAADALIASSEADARAIRTDLPNLDVFAFDVGAYEPRPVGGDQQRGALSFLGNFVHPPNVDAVVWWVEEIAPRIRELCGRDIPLRVIGAWAEILNDVIDGGEALEVVGWVEDLGTELAPSRAFLVPLRYGAGTKDKISIALRYGIPTVTTSIGAESMPPRLLGGLVVADQPDHLAAHVVRLMADDQEWSRAAESARQAARQAWEEQVRVRRRYVTWFSQFTRRSPRSGR